MKFAEDLDFLASSTMDCLVKVYRTNPHIRLCTYLKGHSEPVTGIEFYKRKQRLVTVSTDKTIKVWEYIKGTTFFDVRKY